MKINKYRLAQKLYFWKPTRLQPFDPKGECYSFDIRLTTAVTVDGQDGFKIRLNCRSTKVKNKRVTRLLITSSKKIRILSGLIKLKVVEDNEEIFRFRRLFSQVLRWVLSQGSMTIQGKYENGIANFEIEGGSVIHYRHGLIIEFDENIEFESTKLVIGRSLDLNIPANLISWKQAHGKTLNKSNAKYLLETVYFELEKMRKEPLLAFGTLLGAVREKDFISHDTDVDLIILGEDWVSSQSQGKVNGWWLRKLSERLRARGIFLVRDIQGLKSFWYETDYLDLYIFSKSGKRKEWRLWQFVLTEDEIGGFSYSSLLGKVYRTPANTSLYLENRYGCDWDEPKLDYHAKH